MSRSRKILAGATIALAVGAAIPAMAQTSPRSQVPRVTRAVNQQFTRYIRSRGRVTGIRVSNVRTVCAAAIGWRWSCYSTYVGSQRRQSYKYGVFIDARRVGSGLRWRVVGRPERLR